MLSSYCGSLGFIGFVTGWEHRPTIESLLRQHFPEHEVFGTAHPRSDIWIHFCDECIDDYLDHEIPIEGLTQAIDTADQA